MGIFNSFRIAPSTTTMAAGLAAASPIFSAMWSSDTKWARLRSLAIQMMSLGTGFAAGSGLFEVHRVTGYTLADTGGVAVSLASPIAKINPAWVPSDWTDMRISTTAALTPGTRDALPTWPFASVLFGVTTAVNTVHLATTKIWDVADAPMVIGPGKGLVILATVPATGTWKATITPCWEEMEPF